MFAQSKRLPIPAVKGYARKMGEAAVTLKWIAAQLHMGVWTHVANRLQNAKRSKSNQTINMNSALCKYSGL